MNSNLFALLRLAVLAIGMIPGLVDTTRTVYVYQLGTPAAIQNFIQPDAGCNWTGVGGQIFSPEGLPVTDLTVRVTGTFNGQQVLQVTVTGSSLAWGPGGFSITLGDHPVASQGTLHIQLFNTSGTPISPQIPFSTHSTCDKNLVLLNLVLTTFNFDNYLPLVHRKIQ